MEHNFWVDLHRNGLWIPWGLFFLFCNRAGLLLANLENSSLAGVNPSLPSSHLSFPHCIYTIMGRKAAPMKKPTFKVQPCKRAAPNSICSSKSGLGSSNHWEDLKQRCLSSPCLGGFWSEVTHEPSRDHIWWFISFLVLPWRVSSEYLWQFYTKRWILPNLWAKVESNLIVLKIWTSVDLRFIQWGAFFYFGSKV